MGRGNWVPLKGLYKAHRGVYLYTYADVYVSMMHYEVEALGLTGSHLRVGGYLKSCMNFSSFLGIMIV